MDLTICPRCNINGTVVGSICALCKVSDLESENARLREENAETRAGLNNIIKITQLRAQKAEATVEALYWCFDNSIHIYSPTEPNNDYRLYFAQRLVARAATLSEAVAAAKEKLGK